MTEEQWLSWTNPAPMLNFLNERDASARKFRLFSSACARRLWSLMSGEHARKIVLDAERYAEGLLSERERRQRKEEFRATFPPRMTPDYPVPPSYLADMVAFYTIWANSCSYRGPTIHLNEHGARCVSEWVGFTMVFQETGDWEARPPWNHPIGRAEADTHCRLIRDIFGNPFRPVALDPALLTWRGGAIVKLAQAVYEERDLPSGHLDSARLAVLADMLEEAGCCAADVLGHLRGPGPHWRGCWVLDAVLGKE
jgi:hypothetical protein